MYFPLLGEQKRGSAARPPEVKGKLALRTLHLLLCFPSVHLSGRRQTMALSGRWMEVVDERWRQKEQESKRESEGEMYGSPHCLRQHQATNVDQRRQQSVCHTTLICYLDCIVM